MPVAIQDGFIQVAFIIITIFANNRGLDDSAAVGIVEKIISIIFLVPSSMLSAVSALSAQNLGANEERRARLTLMYSTVISVCYGIVIAVIVFIIAKSFVSIFNDKSENVAVLGSQYLRGYIWDTVFAGVHFCFSGYFCACKKSYIIYCKTKSTPDNTDTMARCLIICTRESCRKMSIVKIQSIRYFLR